MFRAKKEGEEEEKTPKEVAKGRSGNGENSHGVCLGSEKEE